MNAMTLVSTWLNGRTERTHPRLILIATSLGVLFAQIDTSVVNLAVKSIAADLHAGVSEMQWVIDSYNLVYASLLLTGGHLAIFTAVDGFSFWGSCCSSQARWSARLPPVPEY
jgi:MFS family permease